jgi:hypothetical protein
MPNLRSELVHFGIVLLQGQWYASINCTTEGTSYIGQAACSPGHSNCGYQHHHHCDIDHTLRVLVPVHVRADSANPEC